MRSGRWQCRVWSPVRPGEDDPLEGEALPTVPGGGGAAGLPHVGRAQGSGGEVTLSASGSKSRLESPLPVRGAARSLLLTLVVAPAVAEGGQGPGQTA